LYPAAFEIVCFTAVNGEHVRDVQLPVADNSEVVFMSKFSGAEMAEPETKAAVRIQREDFSRTRR